MPGRWPFPAARSIPATKARSPRRCARPRRRSASRPILIEPIGYLDLYLTFSGFRILPTVARVKPDFSLALNPCEVTETFEVPLAFLMTPANHQRKTPRLERDRARILRDTVRRTATFGASPRVSCEISTSGFTAHDQADLHRDRAVSHPVRALCAYFCGDARRRAATSKSWTMPRIAGARHRVAV